MNANDDAEIAKWDPAFIERFGKIVSPVFKQYFRSEVRGIDLLPHTGGALVVCNHSGGVLTPDPLILLPAFYEHFGFDRPPLYILAHYGVFFTPLRGYLSLLGTLHAGRENAARALQSGAVVLVFPGGDYDAFRPTLHQNVIDFDGRTGYVKVAIDAGVPIVPTVSIGGQETQLFLSRGNWLAKRVGLTRLRAQIFPFTVGFPFGVTTFFPANLPLPSKIIYRVLEPIDIVGTFGENPDIGEVDGHVRAVMQQALDRLARERRFPVLG